MNQLLKIALIKSAKFEYSEVDVNGNTLLIGANGAGKTTFLRAMLYFYTANAKSLGINIAKKTSFSDYYFEYENSYIAYIYKKDKKYILAIVYRLSSIYFRLCLFNEMPNLKKIFIENEKLLKPQELWLKLKDEAIVSNVLKPNEYLKMLYAKDKQKLYSLFFLKDYKGFVKTLSNIFINSKVDSNTIKKVLTSSLEDDVFIDLDRVKRQLSGFEVVYNDIKSFEANINIIKKISLFLKKISEIKSKLALNFSIIEHSKQSVLNEIDILDKKIDKKENELNTKKESLQKLKKQTTAKIEKLNQEIGIAKDKIKKIDEKKQFYQKENLEFKINEYKKLPNFENKLTSMIDQKEFLTKKQTDLQKAHQNEIDKLKNSFEKEKNLLLTQKLQNEKELNDKLNELKLKQNDEINELTQTINDKKEKLQININELTINLNNIQNEIDKLKNTKFIFDEEDVLNKLNIEKINLENKKELLLKDIKSLSNQIELVEENFIQKQNDTKNSYQKNIDKLHKQILNQKELISPNKSSLLGKLYSSDINTDKYLYFLKDEVLKKEFDISFKEVSNDVFEVKFDNLNVPKIDINETLKNLDEKLQSLKKELKIELSQIKKDFEKAQKKLILQKNKTNEQLKQIDINITLTNTKIQSLQIKQDELKKEFEAKKEQDLQKLDEKKEKLKDQIKVLNEEKQNLEKKKKSKISSIKIFYTKEKNTILEKLKQQNEEYEQNLKNIEKELKNKIKIQEENYLSLLKKENIDINRLKELENKIKALKQKIDTIKSYQRLIYQYEEDLKEFEKLKLYKKELKNLQENLTNIKEEFEKNETILNDEITFINSEIFSKKNELSNLKKEYNNFLEFEKSTIFIQALKLVEFENINETNGLFFIQQEITNLKENYTQIENKITNLINKISFIFDNSLNIKKEADTLKTALSLQEFYEEDKITHYKDMLNNQINNIVKVLNEEYEKLFSGANKIKKFISKINSLFKEIDIGVIDEVELRYSKTDNRALNLLEDIKLLNDESFGFGISLFSSGNETAKMIGLLKKLVETINDIGVDSISLEDSFVLEFRVVENGNDSGYQISLDNIGSNGTDVLVKSMIYIAMVHINKINAKDLVVHVILDEIGILSQKYLKALIEFANKYKILFINGAPDEKLIGTYKKVYLIKRNQNYSTAIEIVGME